MRRQSGDVFAVIKNLAGLRFQQTRNRFQRRRLARAIAADERDNAAGPHGQGDALQRGNCAVADRQIFYLQHGVNNQQKLQAPTSKLQRNSNI